VFSLRLTELPMPTGSRDADVLVDWLLESMGLVRRRVEGSGEGEYSGTLHRIMRGALLADPLRGWDSRGLGDETGLSNTGIHHQMTKLRECGLVSTKVEGKWHRHVLRGGSISSATRLVGVQAKAILGIQLMGLSALVKESEIRMEVQSEDEEPPLSIRISEPGPREEGREPIDMLVDGIGLSGDSPRADDRIASQVLSSICSSDRPVTILALSERISESRGRVKTVIERMRAAGMVERVPMLDRIPQDVFTGLMRQLDARGEEWLLSKGGLGRLDGSVSKKLVEGAKAGSLDIEGVRTILKPVTVSNQRILLNTIGGRMPLGFRIAGKDHKSVSERVMRMAERTIRRINTVAERLDQSLQEEQLAN